MKISFVRGIGYIWDFKSFKKQHMDKWIKSREIFPLMRKCCSANLKYSGHVTQIFFPSLWLNMGSRSLAVSGAAGLGWIVLFRILWLRDLHCYPAQGVIPFFSLMSPLLSGSFPVQLCLLPCCLPQCYSLSNLPVWTRHPHLSSEKTHLTEGFFRLCQVLVLWSIPDPLISQLEKIKWGSQPEIWFEVGEEPIKSWISLFGKSDSSQNCSSTFML